MQAHEGRLPDSLVACIGGGSNAMGLFHPFLDDKSIEIIGVEAAGYGIETGKHAASLNGGVPGVLHGNRTFLLQDDDGQIIDAHSISAGLDCPGIGPEHAWLHDIGRVQYTSVTDDEALAAFHQCCRLEGIIPALESAHALAEVFKRAEPAERSPDGGQPVGPWRQRHANRYAPHGTIEAGETLMSRLQTRFAELKEQNRAALVTFVTAGDPSYDTSWRSSRACRRLAPM